ncbi:MAG: hypothetical protein IJ420_11745, partial [Lachnospiraceae bacterium]|nr:hypothetical protein [Lachnospiraceae bacterium]
MTCYYDENTYLKFGVFIDGGKTYLKVQEHVDNDTWDSFAVELTDAGCNAGELTVQEIVLRCDTKGLERTFSYKLCKDTASADVEFTLLGTLPNVYYLCDEGLKRGKRFTGAMIGVYVHGNGVRVPVRYFKMTDSLK